MANIKNYIPEPYILTALTNMHVGSGKQNYGIIDNLVQKDGHFPTINSSGLKGTLKEKHGDPDSKSSKFIFGGEKDDANLNAGEYRFFSADLLSLPVRADCKAYCCVTSPALIRRFNSCLESFGIPNKYKSVLEELITLLDSNQAIHFDASSNNKIILEDLDIKAVFKAGTGPELKTLENLLGNDFILVSDQVMIDLCSDFNLPVIARNHLLNGKSANLWYEQVVPRQAKFSFIVLKPSNKENYSSEFGKLLVTPTQIGGNASIGYGFSEIKPIISESK